MAGGHRMAPGHQRGARGVRRRTARSQSGTPDRRFSLTAQAKKVKLASGKVTVDAWTAHQHQRYHARVRP
ncbi:hypothetical protein LV779_34870 [Streptomyces thinghirensis]|nr:hypothetical protein [Streptomyces thinghirensis]